MTYPPIERPVRKLCTYYLFFNILGHPYYIYRCHSQASTWTFFCFQTATAAAASSKRPRKITQTTKWRERERAVEKSLKRSWLPEEVRRTHTTRARAPTISTPDPDADSNQLVRKSKMSSFFFFCFTLLLLRCGRGHRWGLFPLGRADGGHGRRTQPQKKLA